MWKRRREAKDKVDICEGRAAKFVKFDLTSLIIAEKLKTASSIREYAQDRGTVAMQAFVDKHADKLDDFLKHAALWETAREDARRERQTDWELLVATASSRCKHGEHACKYMKVTKEFFKKNKAISWTKFAAALRDIIQHGPSKTTKVPMLVGNSNTGKSTIVQPFDNLFGFDAVLHKPAQDNKFGLRNVAKQHKRLRLL